MKYEEEQYLIHQDLLDEIDNENCIEYETKSAYIVGVLEEPLFWRDTRRTLFSDLDYKVLCRVASNGIKDSWSPVKSAQVFEMVAPDFEKQLTDLRNKLTNNESSHEDNSDYEQEKAKVNIALCYYSSCLIRDYHLEENEISKEKIDVIAEKYINEWEKNDIRKSAFDEIAAKLLNEEQRKENKLQIADYRKEAIEFSDKTLKKSNSASKKLNNEKEALIDSEFIAIYW